jgi:hypothetical protein
MDMKGKKAYYAYPCSICEKPNDYELESIMDYKPVVICKSQHELCQKCVDGIMMASPHPVCPLCR